MKKRNFKLSNLVVLVFSANQCYVNVVPAKGFKGLSFDLVAGTWWEVGGGTREIGQSGYGEVLGVYDRTEIKHLESMVFRGKEATDHHEDAD